MQKYERKTASAPKYFFFLFSFFWSGLGFSPRTSCVSQVLQGTATAFKHFVWDTLKLQFIDLDIRGLVSQMQNYSEENKPVLQSLSRGWFPSWLQMSACRGPAAGRVWVAAPPSHLSIFYKTSRKLHRAISVPGGGLDTSDLLQDPQGWLEHRWLIQYVHLLWERAVVPVPPICWEYSVLWRLIEKTALFFVPFVPSVSSFFGGSFAEGNCFG